MRKLTIGKEAFRQLTMMGEMLAEDHWNGNAVHFHANSANNYLASIQIAGMAVPDFITRVGRPFLKAHGWRV